MSYIGKLVKYANKDNTQYIGGTELQHFLNHQLLRTTFQKSEIWNVFNVNNPWPLLVIDEFIAPEKNIHLIDLLLPLNKRVWLPTKWFEIYEKRETR